MSYENAIEIKGLNKSFSGGFHLDNVDLTLPAGSIMGFIGENGAGKTTTIKLILNQLRRDSGTISVMGMDNQKQELEMKKDIGVVLDQGFFYENLSPAQIGNIMAAMYTNWDAPLYQSYLDRFKIPVKQSSKEFSRGMKMKLAIIAALSHHPKVLLLDEPTSGLDPVVRSEILDLFLDFIQDEEHSILFSTHITTDLEKIADYISFIHEGRVLFTDTKDTILDEYGIVKCGLSYSERIASEDHLGSRKGAFGYETLVKNRREFARKYPDFTIDPATLEDIMLFYIKTE